MNHNESCGTDDFLIKSCPAVVQALYLLSLKFSSSAHQTEMTCMLRLNIFHFKNIFTEVNASKQIIPLFLCLFL
jgi:hypothetical protein